MLKKIEQRVYSEIQELFILAAVDEMAGHMDDYKEKLEKIARVCEVLGVGVEVVTTVINLKS